VVDYSQAKKLVVTGLSEAHTSTEQFIFMQDPTNPQYTIVRYVAELQLREWRSALQPIAARELPPQRRPRLAPGRSPGPCQPPGAAQPTASPAAHPLPLPAAAANQHTHPPAAPAGLLAKLPEEALAKLGKVLNAAASPLYTPHFEAQYLRVYGKQRAPPKSPGGSPSGTTKTRAPRATPKWSLGGIFSSNLGSMGERLAASAPERPIASAPPGRPGSACTPGPAPRRRHPPPCCRHPSPPPTHRPRPLTAPAASMDQEPAGAASHEPLIIVPSGDAMGYYQVLGLPWAQGVSPDQIKSAYRKAVLDCHPDKFLNSDARTREAASRRFQQLTKAYDTLRDPDSRRLYDEGKLFEMSESF
jgi:hypothetical protein